MNDMKKKNKAEGQAKYRAAGGMSSTRELALHSDLGAWLPWYPPEETNNSK